VKSLEVGKSQQLDQSQQSDQAQRVHRYQQNDKASVAARNGSVVS
jgi:hypothetical protein